MPGRRLDAVSFWTITLTLLVGIFFMDSIVLYPFRLFTTLVHETGHALAAEVSFGDAVQIRIAPNGAGVCTTRGGWRFLVVSGGYLGSALFGGGLLWLSSKPKIRDYLLETLATGFLFVIVFTVRDLFTFAYASLLVAVLFFVGLKTNPAVEFVVVKVLATFTSVYALNDVKSLASISMGARAVFIGGVGRSDAQALADMTGIPAILWALAWGGLALWFLVKMAVAAAEGQAAELQSEAGGLRGSDAEW